LLQFELADIFLHDVRHSHSQSRRIILRCHRLLLLLVRQKPNQAVRQLQSISRLEKIYGQFFAIRHLAEVGQIRTNNGHSIGAG
jgi:hypothetical protein